MPGQESSGHRGPLYRQGERGKDTCFSESLLLGQLNLVINWLLQHFQNDATSLSAYSDTCYNDTPTMETVFGPKIRFP